MTSTNPFFPNAVGEYNTERTQQCSHMPHMAMCFVLDVSGSMTIPRSMGKTALDALNDGMNLFIKTAREDKDTCPILDVAIITFDHEIQVVHNFITVEDMQPVKFLSRNGGTCFAPPMKTAIQMVRERRRYYQQYTPPFKPWIVLITDGQREDHESEQAFNSVVGELQREQIDGKLAVRSLGVEGYDSKTLHLLSDYPRTDGKAQWYQNVLKLEGFDFTGFFNWVQKSMAAISRSAPSQTVPPAALQQSSGVSVDLDLSRMG